MGKYCEYCGSAILNNKFKCGCNFKGYGSFITFPDGSSLTHKQYLASKKLTKGL